VEGVEARLQRDRWKDTVGEIGPCERSQARVRILEAGRSSEPQTTQAVREVPDTAAPSVVFS
jgi:hypothetical protein